ncbi:hypothetical protein LZZ85_12620 [Terrimonas sp. NA20]|uniref:Uncharacterized protein n=1 Tax=Terrimonas ginsenosidimutans TaxID=2908004 RepID=A0ABS9KS85_9BACT|nr:hypothetical protein [Terrimonas ginsenosidimutans]MCG2615135.1 hypothetical protein [Terrimonas ginsenosidimutans]
MFLLSIILIPVFILLTLYLFWLRPLRKKNNSVRLFNIARKSENNSSFQQAIGEYETALDEIKRTGNNIQLRTRIMEKIKLLNTVLQYQRG